MAVPDIRSLSAFDINKIQQSLNKYKATQGSYRDAPGYDPNQRGFRSQFEEAKRKAAKPRREFQRGKDYDIEDEYRYMVSQGFKPESMQIAPEQQPAAASTSSPEPTTVTSNIPAYDPNSFINRFGGNKETMAHSGLAAVKRAEAAGMSLEEIQRTAAAQGISFGQKAQDKYIFQSSLDPHKQSIVGNR